jgi:hypothetical protein
VIAMSRFLIVALLLVSAPGPSGQALVVVSEQTVFRTAAAGASRTLPNARTVAADTLSDEDVQTASVIVAIGPLAVRALGQLAVPDSTRVVACLSPTGRGLSTSAVVLPLFPTSREVLSTIGEFAPRAKRIGIFRSDSHPFSRADAEKLGFTVVEPDDSKALLGAIDQVLAKSDVVWVADPSVFGREMVALEYLVKSAVARGVPVIGANRAMVESGALLALVPDPERVGAAAGALADAMRSATPLPEPPPMTQVLVGERALKRYGLTVPTRLEPRVVRVK